MMTTAGSLTKILFAHSAGPQYGPGKGSYDLVKYLRTGLGDGFQVLFPKIDKPNSPTYEKYKKMYRFAFMKLTEPVILVGHSLGASTLLKYLSEEKHRLKIRGLFLAATPHWKSNMKEFQLEENFQLKLKEIAPVFLYQSKNDPELSPEHLAFYRDKLNWAKTREIEGDEHAFSKGLPVLMEDIRSIVT
ncbi:MAG: hypothetical protein DI535_14000 [Citrobacter freundii]|nr:MAG: hypothetical protein DI535_14000 [Citrobacter freundii]